MVKKQIIRVAITLFAKKGIEAISLEDIATETGIPVKSIHTEFKNREKLIEECIKEEAVKIRASASAALFVSRTVLENLILVMYIVLQRRIFFQPVFYKDLNRYPVACKSLMAFNLNFQNYCMLYYQQSVEEGYIIPSDCNEHKLLIFTEITGGIASKCQYRMIQTLFNDICTQEGLAELSRIMTIIETNTNKIIQP